MPAAAATVWDYDDDVAVVASSTTAARSLGYGSRAYKSCSSGGGTSGSSTSSSSCASAATASSSRRRTAVAGNAGSTSGTTTTTTAAKGGSGTCPSSPTGVENCGNAAQQQQHKTKTKNDTKASRSKGGRTAVHSGVIRYPFGGRQVERPVDAHDPDREAYANASAEQKRNMRIKAEMIRLTHCLERLAWYDLDLDRAIATARTFVTVVPKKKDDGAATTTIDTTPPLPSQSTTPAPVAASDSDSSGRIIQQQQADHFPPYRITSLVNDVSPPPTAAAAAAVTAIAPAPATLSPAQLPADSFELFAQHLPSMLLEDDDEADIALPARTGNTTTATPRFPPGFEPSNHHLPCMPLEDDDKADIDLPVRTANNTTTTPHFPADNHLPCMPLEDDNEADVSRPARTANNATSPRLPATKSSDPQFVRSAQHNEAMMDLLRAGEDNDGDWTSEQSMQYRHKLRNMLDGWKDRMTWTKAEARLAGKVLRAAWRFEERFLKKRDFLNLLNAYSKSGLVQEAQNTLDWLDDQSTQDPKLYGYLKPSRTMINTVTGGLAKHAGGRDNSDGNTSGVSSKEAPLEAVKNLRRLSNPNARAYGKVIDAYVRGGNADAGWGMLRELETTYRQWRQEATTSSRDAVKPPVPTVECYSTTIQGFVRCARNEHAPSSAEEVLRANLAFYDEFRLPQSAPNARLFGAMIRVWSRSKRKDRSYRIHKLLDLMRERQVEFDLHTYNDLIAEAVSDIDCPGSIERAERLLNDLERHGSLNPTQHSYHAVLGAYVRTRQGKKARDLLRRWEENVEKRREQGDDEQLPKEEEGPTRQSYCLAIKASIRSGMKAEEALDRMVSKGYRPNTECFNGVLESWAYSMKQPDALLRAQTIWDRMPLHNSLSYGSLIGAYVRGADGDVTRIAKSENLFREGIEKQIFKPNAAIINEVVQAIVDTGDKDSIDRAEQLIELVLDTKAGPPDFGCYCSVLRAYRDGDSSSSSTKPRDPCKAMALFRRMIAVARPTVHAYCLSIDAACRSRRDDHARELFDDCTGRGRLNNVLFQKFRYCGAKFVEEQLDEYEAWDDLPQNWRHAVPATNRGK